MNKSYPNHCNKIIATSSSSSSSSSLTSSSSSSSSSSTTTTTTTSAVATLASSKTTSNDINSNNRYLPSISKLLSCGLISGLMQAAVFNPWDRALYLSVKDNRNFLHVSNFHDPFAGVLQTITQRTISNGLYFPLEDIFRKLLNDNYSNILSPYWLTFHAGTIAGAINGIIMNPVSSIKYHYWGHAECGKENFYSTAKEMYLKGNGVKTFFVGATATIIRDVLFGGAFSLLRHELLSSSSSSSLTTTSLSKQQESFAINLVSAMVATIISSPLNYVRNIHYSTAPNIQPLSSFTILNNLFLDARNQPTVINQMHVIQSRLRIGWGTARVGCGMAFSANIYSLCSKSINE